MRVHFARLTIIALTLGFFSPEFAIATSEEPKSEPFPQGIGKKGLQVQMVDDAISLGIHHAAININLTSLLQLDPKQNTIRFAHGGKEWFMNGSYAASLDRQIQPLSDATIIVYAILLAYPSRDSARDAVMLHPNATGSFTIAAFNTAGEEGLQAYRAIISTSCFKKQIPQTGRRRWNLHCPLLDSGNGMTSMNRGTQFQNVLNPSIC